MVNEAHPRFSTAFRGYKTDDVDQLLSRIGQALESPGQLGNISGAEVSQVQFKVVLRGYDMREVDGFLADAIQQLEPAGVPLEHIELAPAGRPESLFARPRGQRFARKRMERGYRVDEVDHLIEEFESTLDTTLTSQRAHEATVNNAWRGYDVDEVDLWLDEVVAYLRERGR